MVVYGKLVDDFEKALEELIVVQTTVVAKKDLFHERIKRDALCFTFSMCLETAREIFDCLYVDNVAEEHIDDTEELLERLHAENILSEFEVEVFAKQFGIADIMGVDRERLTGELAEFFDLGINHMALATLFFVEWCNKLHERYDLYDLDDTDDGGSLEYQ